MACRNSLDKRGFSLGFAGNRGLVPAILLALEIQTSRVITMPKQKTHKGMKKRFKVTASGKVKHRKAFRGHILGKKSGKRKRHLRQDGVIVGAEAVQIAEALRPGA